MRRAAIALLALTLSVAAAPVQLDARQASPPPTIHRVTLQPADGVLVIEGTGLGAGLIATVDGQPVTTLPGATEHRMDVRAPASVLTTPGTYRLTVVDPVRRAWDGFVVASAPLLAPGVVAAAGSSSSVTGRERIGSTDAAAPAASRDTTPNAIRPFTVIEDAGSPFRTAIGDRALVSNTTGTFNTGLGYQALEANTTGSNNTAVGARALEGSNGSDNTAVGRLTLNNNSSGFWNTALGAVAQFQNTTGLQNTAVGNQALFNNVTGDNNVAAGVNALFGATGNDNTGLGFRAGENLLAGTNNILIGANVVGTSTDANTIRIGLAQTATFIAGIRGTTVSAAEGVYVDPSGRLGSGPVVPGANTVDSSHVIDASLTAADLATGSVGGSEIADGAIKPADFANGAVDTAAIDDNAVTAAKVAFNYAGSASEGGAATNLACAGCVAASEVSFAFAGLGANSFAGTQTIGGNLDLPTSSSTSGNLTKNGVRFLHDTGTQNTFLGQEAGAYTVAGFLNTAVGGAALRDIAAGGSNTAVGGRALLSNTDGHANTAVGYHALRDGQGGYNTAVGVNAGVGNATGSENIYLGANVGTSNGAEANTMRLGLPYHSPSATGQNRTFIAGVAGTVLTTPAVQVFVDANGQLGTLVPAPITGAIDGTVTPGAVERRLADQDATIAAQRALMEALRQQQAAQATTIEQLRADLAALRAAMAAPARRR